MNRTRAYRMKLKEWGLMRHKSRKPVARSGKGLQDEDEVLDDDHDDRSSSATAEPMAIDITPMSSSNKRDVWQVADDTDSAHADPAFMGMLPQTSA
jgi:hypothetical protein